MNNQDLPTLLAELDAAWNAVGPLHTEPVDDGVDLVDAGLRCLAEIPTRLGVLPEEVKGVVALVNAYPQLREAIEQAIKTQQHMDETLRPLVEELRKAAHQARAREIEVCAEAARLRTERDEQLQEPTTYHCSGCPSLQGDRLTPEEREIVEHDRGRSTIYIPELLIDIIDRLAPKPEVP